MPEIHNDEPISGASPCNSSQLDCSNNISLLFNRGSMVAKAIKITNRSVIHGHEFNIDIHAIFHLLKLLIRIIFLKTIILFKNLQMLDSMLYGNLKM